MADENVNGDTPTPAPVQVGFHPLGGISITARGADGSQATARLTVDEVWKLVGHVNILAGMLIQAAYAEAVQQQQQSSLIVPGRP